MERYGAICSIPTRGNNVQPLPYRESCHPPSGPCYHIEQEIRAQPQVPPHQQIQAKKFLLLMLLFNFTVTFK